MCTTKQTFAVTTFIISDDSYRLQLGRGGGRRLGVRHGGGGGGGGGAGDRGAVHPAECHPVLQHLRHKVSRQQTNSNTVIEQLYRN